MNSRINELLAKGRINVLEPQVTALEEMLHDMAYGGSEPGTLGAYNKPTAHEELDSYLLDIKDGLMQHHGMEVDDAWDFVFDCADELAEMGQLPELPEDDAAAEDVVEWLSAAKSIGFANYVQESAQAETDGIPGAGENGEELEIED